MADSPESGFNIVTPECNEAIELITDYLQPALDKACGGSFATDGADELILAREMSDYSNEHTYSLRFFAYKSSKICEGPQRHVVYEVTLANEYPWQEGQYWPAITPDDPEYEDYDPDEDHAEGRFVRESYTFTIDDNTFKPRKDVEWRFVEYFDEDEEPTVWGVEGLHISTGPQTIGIDSELSAAEEGMLEEISKDFLHTFSKEDVSMIINTLGKLGLRGCTHE